MRSGSILVLLMASSPAWAGGYTLPVHGVRGLSMGGAQVASVSGVDAIFHNPANLGATELSLDAALISLQSSYTSGDQLAENDAPLTPNPQLGLVWKVAERASIGIAAYAPYAGHLRYQEDGPQRYALVQNHESKVLFIHLAGAIRLGNLRLGAGVQNVVAHLRQRMVLSGYTGLFGYARDPELDVVCDMTLDDPFTLTANFGAAYEIGPLTFGLGVQLPFTLSGETQLNERLPSSVFFDNVAIEGNQAQMEVPFPLMARAGIALKATEWLLLEVAGTFEDWSVQQTVEVHPTTMRLTGTPLIGDYRLGPVVLQRRMRDTFSFHLGGDADVGKGWHLRTGIFYEPSAFSDETYSAALPDDTKLGLGMGASWRVGSFRFDASLARVFQGTREVSASTLRQTNPTNPTQAEVIGNGTYESGYWMGGVAIAWIPAESADLGRAEDTLDVSLE